MEDLAAARRWYAEDLRIAASVRSKSLIEAFASVPRERFLGPAPWRITSPRLGGIDPSQFSYRTESDIRVLYHDVLVALDEGRKINNGQPSFWAINFDHIDPKIGEAVVHVGCGTGYYTAILAELVGPTGTVTAIEIDDVLVARARAALAPWANVAVAHADGTQQIPAEADVIVVNAGMTHPLPLWLDALKSGGRLLLPLTVDGAITGTGLGLVLLITHKEDGFSADVVCPTGIIHCANARDANAQALLGNALRARRSDLAKIATLRRDAHEETPQCWLHGEGYCLSTDMPSVVH